MNSISAGTGRAEPIPLSLKTGKIFSLLLFIYLFIYLFIKFVCVVELTIELCQMADIK